MVKEKPKKLPHNIFSLSNPHIKHLVRLRIDSHYRKEQQSVLVLGTKLITHLSKWFHPKYLFTTKSLLCPHILVSKQVMKKITGLPSPEGTAAVFSLPQPQSLKDKSPLLVLDKIQDPGNMGTLLRTACALNWQGVFFLPGCVDPFHEKVLRASQGALFFLNWKQTNWEELYTLPHKRYLADLQGEPLSQISFYRHSILLLSNEGQGVSSAGKHFGKAITIPMCERMESLNVAISGAIMMYALKQQGETIES